MCPIGSAFSTAKPLLHEMLEQIHRGAIQLPNFQCGWVKEVSMSKTRCISNNGELYANSKFWP